jgi:lactate dehydrogenase-like 2-hydroxyacid dehydrogenase
MKIAVYSANAYELPFLISTFKGHAYFEKLKLYKNVLITGHQGFLTDTALRNIAEASLYNLNCFAKGMKCENELY